MPALARSVQGFPSAGTYSVWAGPLSGEPWFVHAADTQHYAASTMKLALVMAAYREDAAGRLDLNGLVSVHNQHASVLDGRSYCIDADDDGDPEPWARLGSRVALRWLAYRALVRSSNLATNLVLQAVGLEPVAALLGDVGARHSVVSRGIEDGTAREAGHQNLVTAEDLGLELQSLAAGTLLGDAASEELLAVLAAQQINDAIPAALPAGTRVAHKSGWVDGCSHDAGIIYPPDDVPFVFTMCTTSNLDEGTGLDLIATAAAAAWADVTRAA